MLRLAQQRRLPNETANSRAKTDWRYESCFRCVFLESLDIELIEGLELVAVQRWPVRGHSRVVLKAAKKYDKQNRNLYGQEWSCRTADNIL
jgi:hypothetical protein